jgi:diguanylate cyclase (GGDEF)-like protein/PAS domain S-box-containing protein
VGREAESQVLDVTSLRMRQASIVAALWMTVGVVALGGLYAGLTWSRPHRLLLVCLLLVSIGSSVPVFVLRERIVHSRFREPFFLSWTLSDFVLLVAGTLLDKGTASPLALVFFMPVVFSSMSYPLRSVTIVGVCGVLSYLFVAVVAGGTGWPYQIGFAFALVCTGAMSVWQAQNHMRQRRTLETVSRTDALTGCLNRRGFEERAVAQIGGMRRRGGTGALVMLDIDNFKPVNDTLGHAAGDELLCWVVATVQETVRASDAVGRLGGDEFAVMLPDIDPEQAQVSAQRIAAALALRAPTSLGLACYPLDGTDLEGLSRSADARLYASREGRYPSLHDFAEHAGQDGHGFGPTDLWRAAMDAMPAQRSRRRERHESNLQAALLDQIDASVIATDMDGVVISWNGGAESLYGWSAEEAVGREAKDLIVPEDTRAAEALVVELSRSGCWDGELTVKRKDGSTFTAYVRNRLVLDEHGQPSAIVGVAVDISKRVAAEEELLQSRNYAQAVTECMGEGLLTIDPEGRLTYANRRAESLLGFSREQLRGRVLTEVLRRPAGDGSAHEFGQGPIARALLEERTITVDDDEFLTRTGRLSVAYTAAPFRTDDGQRGCAVIFGDISERKRREEEHRRDAQRLATIARIEHALAEESFELHAQPIVDLRSGETIQHELLIRMREPDGRLTPPADFLPVAENSAMIGEIDWWVIKQAARLAGAGSPVELNISARSVGDLEVLEHVERCIAQYGVPPGRMVFEITETTIVEDQEAARVFAEGLHRLGCGIALDDFGTGYGGLTYLKQIPVDLLKLDIEFVRDLAHNESSRHVVQALVALARDFGLKTVGEGVEDEQTLEALCLLGVDYAQGFHIARPEPFSARPGDGREPVRIGPREVLRPEPRPVLVRRGGRRRAPAGARGGGA